MTTLANFKQVTLVPPGTWELDPTRSTVGFEVRHLKLMHVRGCFHEVAALISCSCQGVASIAASIDVASIDTGDRRRDGRLCAEDFFDAQRHPTISFTGESHPAGVSDALRLRGMLTVGAVTHPLELSAEPGQPRHENENVELRVRARGALSRREFGLDWDPAFAAGGLVIDDRVTLVLDVVLVPRARSS